MTLIIAVCKEDKAILVADRRLTADGKLIDDESNKGFLLQTVDGKFVVAFTGLARANGFETIDWLLLELLKCGPPDYMAGPILERITSSLNDAFTNDGRLRHVPKHTLYLEIVIVGYLYHADPPLLAFAKIWNQSADGSIGDFKLTCFNEQRPHDGPNAWASMHGAKRGISDHDRSLICDLVTRRISTRKLRASLFDRIRIIAQRPNSISLIGEQLDSITIPRDPSLPATVGSSTSVVQSVLKNPPILNLQPNDGWAVKDLQFHTGPDGPPLSIPRVSGNASCPCNSGKKYRDCHEFL